MPAITFITPPGRPSVLRANTVQDARAQQLDTTATDDQQAPTSLLRPTHSEPAPVAEQTAEPAPLTFQKRVLPQLTTSPEAAADSFVLPDPRKSLDEINQHQTQSSEAKKVSLLSTAMAGSSAHHIRSASTTNLGILRRSESEQARSSLDGGGKTTTGAAEAIHPAPRSRLHFVEPQKEHVPPVTARHEAAPGPSTAAVSSEPPVPSTETTTAAEHPTETEAAPRKRSLVIQEHADVLERAAERAARQANRLSSQALEQHTHPATSERLRQHSASSAGDETASTRSSWAVRTNSRGSSIGTSPSVVSADNAEESSESELTKPSERPAVVPIFSKPIYSERANDQLQVAHPPSSRKLTFISPAPSKRRRSPEREAVSPTRRTSDPDTASSSRHARAVSDSDGHTTAESSRRALAFAACPKPERAARLSPAHATRKSKKKLSASPAPHKLAYPQRLRGIRGTDPIRSPAPNQAGHPAEMSRWQQLLEDVSSEGSGYSEDEEDGDTEEDEDDDDDDDDDDLTQSNASDIQSLTESLTQEGQDGASSYNDRVHPLPSNDIERLRSDVGMAEHQASRRSSSGSRPDQRADQRRARISFSDSQPGPSQRDARRHAGNSIQGQQLSASRISPGQTSPNRTSQSSRIGQTSPLDRKLKPKESLSHPMCFLPDAFEESAPATPTEPESDTYEPPHRAKLLSGWLSEGNSAASSRRTSWQHQQHQTTAAGPRSIGDDGLAVPINALPPFRRTRERTASPGVMSDGEHGSSRSLGGNAAFIRESAGYGRSPTFNADAIGRPQSSTRADALGISVPVTGRPSQPISWRQLSSQHVRATDRPSTGVAGYRRASHSMEPRKATSAFTSPVGSFSQQAHIGSRANAVSGRPVRPSAGKQRAVSSSSHIRSRPLVAPSPHDDVVIATSPPRHDASAHLKHHLAHSPHSPGLNEAQRGVHASGSTTPGWMSDGQLPSQNTSRYWTQRLSSLAQAMSEELSFVGNAVLGKEGRANTATEEGVGQTVHRRSHSVPPEGLLDPVDTPQPEPRPPVLISSRRSSASVPVPKPKPAVWSAARDGPAFTREEEGSSIEEDTPFRFAKKEVGEDGLMRLVVIHTSERVDVPR